MKKIMQTVLVLLLAVSAGACSSKKADTTAVSSETAETQETTAAKESEAAEETDEQRPQVETSFFTMSFVDGWEMDPEKDIADRDDNAWARIKYPDPEDSEKSLVSVTVTCHENDTFEWTKRLYQSGWDPEKLLSGEETAPTYSISGVDFYVKDYGTSAYYYGYLPDENLFFDIYITNTSEMDLVDPLLDSIRFTTEKYTGTATPWYWDGTPYKNEDYEAQAGSITLQSKAIPLSETQVTWDIFSPRIAVIKDKAYMLIDDTLQQYAFDGNSLTFEKEIEAGKGFELIQSVGDTLWLSGWGKTLTAIKDGKVTATYDDIDYFAIAPSGTWGISYLTQSDAEKVTLDGTSASLEPISFPEVSVIAELFVDENHIYVAGSAADGSGHKVFIYDANGNLQTTLANSKGESLGSMTYVAAAKNGTIIGLDGNMRRIMIWNEDGTYAGEVNDEDLFGTDYPWFAGSTMLEDGRILTVMVDERPDKSADETIAFIVSGF